MTRTPPHCLAALALLAGAWTASAAPPTLEATVDVVMGAPTLQRNVSYVTEGKTAGMAWRWTSDDGRRDLGQNFEVADAFEATALALRIEAGVDGQQYGCPYQLTFYPRHTGTSLEGEPIAIIEGTLPPQGSPPHNGTWVVFHFDKVAFKPGAYSFVLQFLQEGTKGQALILAMGPPGAYAGGAGFYSNSDDPEVLAKGHTINFILSDGAKTASAAEQPAVAATEPRVLEVDQRQPGPYATIADAVRDARPGDTIRLAKGSGPYREPLFIPQSGRPGQVITFDGSGETITGFDELTGFQQQDGEWSCELPVPYPCVLAYRGERLVQAAPGGTFTRWARLSPDKKRLILLPGTEPQGWEVSVRDAAVRILNASHQHYRNILATGSTNDGFNLHGTGTDLVFENIQACHNLDEGFSAHDQIDCTVRGGRFWENDNGIGNVANCVMTATDIETWSNLGWGLWLRDCRATLSGVRSWNNGISQIYFDTGARVTCKDVTYAPAAWTERPWTSYKESRSENLQPPYLVRADAQVDGQTPQEAANPQTLQAGT